MHREYHRWYSPSLHRPMDLLIFGHAGAKVLVFPTSMGKFYEWEDRGMMHALSYHINRGWVQFYCIDSVDAESWYARWAHPAGRVYRHMQYEWYILNEVLPLMQQKNPNPFLMTTGASFGAYHAANFAFRHPALVDRVIALSGLYDLRRWMDGFANDNFYFNNPVDYLPGEHDPWRLAQLRHQDIILVTGRDDPHRGNTEYLSQVLWSKGVGNALRLWDGWAHDWPWWKDMLRLYISGHD